MASAVPLYTQDPPAWVRQYLRIPYRECDCWQLCGRIVWDQAGVRLPTYEDDYERSANETLWDERIRGQVAQVVEREMELWPKVEGDPQAFDLALYRVRGTRWHVATVTGGGWVINTDLAHGSHVLRLRDSRWAGMLEGFYRHRDLL